MQESEHIEENPAEGESVISFYIGPDGIPKTYLELQSDLHGLALLQIMEIQCAILKDKFSKSLNCFS